MMNNDETVELACAIIEAARAKGIVVSAVPRQKNGERYVDHDTPDGAYFRINSAEVHLYVAGNDRPPPEFYGDLVPGYYVAETVLLQVPIAPEMFGRFIGFRYARKDLDDNRKAA